MLMIRAGVFYDDLRFDRQAMYGLWHAARAITGLGGKGK